MEENTQKNTSYKAPTAIIILEVIICISLFILGWFGNVVYHDLSNKRFLNGLHFDGNYTKSEAIQYSQSRDKIGDWVCINVKGMEYEEAIETCNHEVGHEIFAEFCDKEDNINKCMEITK